MGERKASAGGNSRSLRQAIWRLTALEPWWKCGCWKVMFLAEWNMDWTDNHPILAYYENVPLLFKSHFLTLGLPAFVNSYRSCHVAMAVDAPLCCWICRSTCQLQRQVSEGQFWRWSHTQTVWISVWVVLISNHTIGLSVPVSPCLLCCHTQQPRTACAPFSLFSHTDTRWENTIDFILLSSCGESSFCLPQNTSSGSHVYLRSSNSTFCNVLFHSCINHSALPYLGHRLQIDYLSGVQCNDGRPG